MVALRHRPPMQAEIVRDSTIMSGDPVVRGTRILAETIVQYLRDGYSREQIFEDFPTLPIDGIAAVEAWAAEQYGPGWLSRPEPHSA